MLVLGIFNTGGMADVLGVDINDPGNHKTRRHEPEQYQHFDFDPAPGEIAPKCTFNTHRRNSGGFLRSPERPGDTGFLQLGSGCSLFVVPSHRVHPFVFAGEFPY